ncbi:MAG: hypothetical protein FWG11_07820, partial [Promicromonosporaceae bacterium]|nr:hypothetical protein [Promicromonosporaceae bacterium]
EALVLCPLVPTVSTDSSAALHYTWEIGKSVDHNSARVNPGVAETFGYTVTVTATKHEDRTEVSVTVSLANHNPVSRPIDGLIVDIGGQTYRPELTEIGAKGAETFTFSRQWAQVQPSVPVTVTYAGQTVYAETVTPRPGVTGDTVTLRDTFPEFGGDVTIQASDTETWAYQYEAARGDAESTEGVSTYKNQACIAGVDVDEGCANVVVKVVRGLPLTVSNSAVAVYNVDHSWELRKQVCAEVIEHAADGAPLACAEDGWADEAVFPMAAASGDFLYRVEAIPNGAGAINAASIQGEIVISNPNAWPVAVTRVIDLALIDLPDIACTVEHAPTPGRPLLVAAGGVETLAYTCALGVPEGVTTLPHGPSAVAITWDNTRGSQASAHATRSFDLGFTPIEWTRADTNDAVSVTDTLTADFGGRFDQPSALINEYTATNEECGLWVENVATLTSNTDEHSAEATTNAIVPCPLELGFEHESLAGLHYTWNIDKSVDHGDDIPIIIEEGMAETFGYAIEVTAIRVEHGTTVDIAATLVNHNPLPQAVLPLTAIMNGVSVEFAGMPASLGAGESVTVHASHTWENQVLTEIQVSVLYNQTEAFAATVNPDPTVVGDTVTLGDTFPEFSAWVGSEVTLLATGAVEGIDTWRLEYPADRGLGLSENDYTNTACLAGDGVVVTEGGTLCDEVTVLLEEPEPIENPPARCGELGYEYGADLEGIQWWLVDGKPSCQAPTPIPTPAPLAPPAGVVATPGRDPEHLLFTGMPRTGAHLSWFAALATLLTGAGAVIILRVKRRGAPAD